MIPAPFISSQGFVSREVEAMSAVTAETCTALVDG